MADYSISKSAVLRLLKEAGVAMRRQPLTEQQVQEERQLRATGMSLAAIAARINAPQETIRRALLDAGAMRPRGGQ